MTDRHYKYKVLQTIVLHEAKCQDCEWVFGHKNVHGAAHQHVKMTGHTVTMGQAFRIEPKI